MIVDGTISRVRPVGPWSDNIMVSNTATHLDIDNIIVGAGRISRRRHEQRDAGQAMDSAYGLCLSPHQ